MTSSTRIIRNVRLKENKTEEDELFLKYSRTIASISEILVSQSKGHIEDGKAVEDIRKLFINNIH